MLHIPLIEDLTMGPVPAGSNISVEFAGYGGLREQ